MFIRKLMLTVVLCFSIQFVFCQLNPWWIDSVGIDSVELEREKIADSVLAYAKTFMGIPYVWGGNDPDSGFDCSGFICHVYEKFGIDLPRTSNQQFDTGVPIAYTEAKPGDLILFSGIEALGGAPGHVGIVISYDVEKGFTFIHTSSLDSGGVRISNEQKEKYYYLRFLEIRRVINVD